ncbi:WD40 repeat domain-containing protein [Streptomyces sp. NBC_01142]|uniref:WD40 repeat domain-containing protein n=1 Tax=Streptomyces sp. NBC_01142 TaxID=2975865 RepID=UPI00224C966B|nr:WD40 repeat domain-containing protein [Streptomyces sp. NBC_01142]MCX4825827.1 WD40 repeat domain-containing protein [Streptomyces sp. NBC_01142]
MSERPAEVPHDVHSLLSDPSLLLVAEPARVIELLDQADGPRSRAVAAVYRASAEVHRTVAPVLRRQVLALDAARLGDAELAAWFGSADVPGQPSPEWGPDWASGSASDPRFLRTFAGHGAPVTAMTTAVVDGQPVAVAGSRDGVVLVWDLTTGSLRHELMTGRTDPVSSMPAELLSLAAALVDGRSVAFTLHADGAVRVWDLETGRFAGELVDIVECATADGRRVVLTMGQDRTLQVWDLLTGVQISTIPWVADIGVLGGRRVAVTAAPDQPVQVWDLVADCQVGVCLTVMDAYLVAGRRPFAVAGEEGEAPRVWDLMTGHPLGEAELAELELSEAAGLSGMAALTAVDNRVVAVALDYQAEPELVGNWTADHRDGGGSIRRRETAVLGARRGLLCAGADQALRVWDLTTSPQRVDGIRAIGSVPSGDGLPALSPDPGERTDLWDLIAGRRSGRISAGTAVEVGPRATSRSLVLQERMVSLAAEKDGTVTVLDAVEGWPSGRPLTGHTDRVCAMDTVHTGLGTLAVTACLDQTVRVWDLLSREQQGDPLTGHTGQVWDLDTTVVEGRPVAMTAGDDHTVRMWDLTQAHGGGRHRSGHTGPVVALATTTLDGRPAVVTAGADKTIRTWDLATGQHVTDARRSEAAVMATADIDGHAVVVTAGLDSTLHVLDPVTGREVRRPTPSHHGKVLAMATTTLDGLPVAVTAGNDRTVGVWDLNTSKALCAPLTGHSSRVTAVATTVLDGRPVAVTGGWDKTVRLWDLTTGHQVGGPLTGHTDWVTSVATATLAGGPAAMTRGRDGTVRLWDLTSMAQVGCHELTESGASGAMAVTRTDDGRLVAVISHEKTLQFLDLATGRKATTDYLLPLPVQALAATLHGRLVVGFGPEVAVLRLQACGAVEVEQGGGAASGAVHP